MSVEGTSELTGGERYHELVLILEILRKQDSKDAGKYDLATLHRLISEHCNAMLQKPIVPKDVFERSRSAAEQANYIAHLNRCFESSNLVLQTIVACLKKQDSLHKLADWPLVDRRCSMMTASYIAQPSPKRSSQNPIRDASPLIWQHRLGRVRSAKQNTKGP